ncbi:MAG: hypothetical protein ACKV2T_35225 [Kofleriaceae bacterium]
MRWLMYSLAGLVAGCTDSGEAARVEIPVTTASSVFAPATTDLGYVVNISEMQAAVSTIQFTIEGERHQDIVVPPGTIAHPGHSAGGEVTGELPGEHVLVWNGQPHAPLGTGTLIAGAYRGANFTFRAATVADDVPALVGHAIHLAGTATKAGTTMPFDILIDVEVDTAIIGAVFEDEITETSMGTLSIAFLPTDPDESDTPLDGVDFFLLPTTQGAIEIRPGSETHNLVRRVITTHDHYGITKI